MTNIMNIRNVRFDIIGIIIKGWPQLYIVVMLFQLISLVAAIANKKQLCSKTKLMAAMESMATSIPCHQHKEEGVVA
jgi:hypothetical protein